MRLSAVDRRNPAPSDASGEECILLLPEEGAVCVVHGRAPRGRDPPGDKKSALHPPWADDR